MGLFDFFQPKVGDSFTVPMPKPKPPMDQLPTATIDGIIKTYLAPALKERGFRKLGRTFYRDRAEWQDLINVQADKWNSREEGSFTINLGIYHEATSHAVLGKYAPKTPHEYDCQIRQRIGFTREKWWKFDHKTDIDALGQDVQSTVVGPGLEFFAKFKNLNDVLTALRRQSGAPLPDQTLAALAYYCGDTPGALNYLGRASNSKYRPSTKWRREAADVAMRLGIPFAPPEGEKHFSLMLEAGEMLDERQAGKLADKILWRILDLPPNDKKFYHYDSTRSYPDYGFDFYCTDEEALRAALSKIIKYAQGKFRRAELTEVP